MSFYFKFTIWFFLHVKLIWIQPRRLEAAEDDLKINPFIQKTRNQL